MALSVSGMILVFGLLGLIGGIAVIWLLKFLGVFDFFNMLNNFLHTIINYVGRVFSFAPKPVQVLLFVVLGLGVIGLVGEFFIAPDYVCASPPAGMGTQNRLYVADSFFTAFAAKMQSADVNVVKTDKTIDSEAKSNWAWNGLQSALNFIGIDTTGRSTGSSTGTFDSGNACENIPLTYGTLVGRWPDIVSKTIKNSSGSGQGLGSFPEGSTVIFLESTLTDRVNPLNVRNTEWLCPGADYSSYTRSSVWGGDCYTKYDLVKRWVNAGTNVAITSTVPVTADSLRSNAGPASTDPTTSTQVAFRQVIWEKNDFASRVAGVTTSKTAGCSIEAAGVTVDGVTHDFPRDGQSSTAQQHFIYSFHEDFAFTGSTSAGSSIATGESAGLKAAACITDIKQTGTGNQVGVGAIAGGIIGGLTCGIAALFSGGIGGLTCGALVGGGAAIGAGIGGGVSGPYTLAEYCTADMVNNQCPVGQWYVCMDGGDCGCVVGKYYSFKELGVEESTLINSNVVTTGMLSSRWQFVQSGIGAGVFKEAPVQKGLLKYTCSAEDQVEARVMGINPFASATIVFIGVLMVFIWLARVLGLI